MLVNTELTHKNYAEYGKNISIIERSRENAFRVVKREFISIYICYISEKVKHAVIAEIAQGTPVAGAAV